MTFSEAEWRAWRKFLFYTTPIIIPIMVWITLLLFVFGHAVSSIVVLVSCSHETWMSYERSIHSFATTYGIWIVVPIGCCIGFLMMWRAWKYTEPTPMFLEMWRGEPVGTVTN